MHVRPFFWFLLAFVCICSLAFAATYHIQVSNILKAHFTQSHLVSNKPAYLEVSLTDSQGLPIDSAHLLTNIYMTNMSMPTRQPDIKPMGPGKYMLQISLSMAGPWIINLQVLADGFLPSQRCFHVQVE